MRARLIVNPESGADRALQLLPLIHRRLRTRYSDVVLTITAGADDARRAGASAVEEQCAALFVAGGDGTVNAALRGMLERGDAAQVPIGIIPLGTGNDFAKALDLGELPGLALDRLLAPCVIAVDVGLMNDRPFFNTSAGGFLADVSEAVTPAMKDVAGKLAYLIGGARALRTTQPFRMRLTASPPVPDASATRAMTAGDAEVRMFAVCNARFIGGGHAIAPNALMDDGLLDVIVVPRMSFIEFMAVLQRIAVSGDAGRGDVLHFRAAALDLDFDRPTHVNVDGEVLTATHCRYRVRPGGARFFCGPNPQTRARPDALSGATP